MELLYDGDDVVVYEDSITLKIRLCKSMFCDMSVAL